MAGKADRYLFGDLILLSLIHSGIELFWRRETMQSNLDFLALYSEVVMAFVAFATIVATLRQAFVGHLTQLQNLLVRFFVWIGFLNLVMALLPIALSTTLSDELLVWRISTYTLLGLTALYLPLYVYRRRKINAPIPLVSLFVMIGYGIALIGIVVTATEIFWPPSLATTTYFLMWGFFSNIAVFVYFLGTFVDIDDAASGVANQS